MTLTNLTYEQQAMLMQAGCWCGGHRCGRCHDEHIVRVSTTYAELSGYLPCPSCEKERHDVYRSKFGPAGIGERDLRTLLDAEER